MFSLTDRECYSCNWRPFVRKNAVCRHTESLFIVRDRDKVRKCQKCSTRSTEIYSNDVMPPSPTLEQSIDFGYGINRFTRAGILARSWPSAGSSDTCCGTVMACNRVWHRIKSWYLRKDIILMLELHLVRSFTFKIKVLDIRPGKELVIFKKYIKKVNWF